MISLQWIYWLAGGYLAWVAINALRDRANPRRLANGSFWGLLALALLAAERLLPAVVGIIVIALACLAGFGGLGRGRVDEGTPGERHVYATRLGNRLFVPALLIPLVAVLLCTLVGALVGGPRRWPVRPYPARSVAISAARSKRARCWS